MDFSFRHILRVLAFSLLPFNLMAQSDMSETGTKAQIKHDLVYRFETVGVTGSGDYAPFWHISNRQGLSSVRKDNGYLHIAALGSMALPSGFDMGYGMDFGVGAGMESNLIVHQLYADLDYKWIGLSIGMKERWSELKNHTLSSGGLTWSGNSQPIPQARLGTLGFVRLPILGDWFSVKAHVGYGRFTDDKWRKNRAEKAVRKDLYTDGLLFHSKDLFFKFGDVERFPLEATIGLEMYAIFGGTMHNRELYADEILVRYDLPSGPDAYLTALLPFNAVGSQGKENGNSLGSWHLSFDYTGREWGVRAYYEHFFEDHSSMLGIEYKSDSDGNRDYVFYGFRRNWFDGLFGVEINLPERLPVRNVVLEVLNTRGQCGPVYKAPNYPVTEGVDGRDAMYNHELYDSYSMSGYAIGSPILISPIYNDNGSQRFRSNRVVMYHIGIDGGLGSHWDYRVLLSNTTHWGTYEDPFDAIQKVTSCLLEGSYRLSDSYGWKIGLSLGLDLNDGDMTGNNTGIMVSLSKTWKIL